MDTTTGNTLLGISLILMAAFGWTAAAHTWGWALVNAAGSIYFAYLARIEDQL